MAKLLEFPSQTTPEIMLSPQESCTHCTTCVLNDRLQNVGEMKLLYENMLREHKQVKAHKIIKIPSEGH